MTGGNNDIFAEKGKATQFPQNDDITFRNMEVITLNAAMRNDYVFGANNNTLFANLKTFHFHFGGLYDATYLETEKHLEKDDIDKIKAFLNNPIGGRLSGNVADSVNREILQEAVRNSLDVFNIYEQAMKKGGFRNISYMSLKKEYKAMESR